MTIDDIRQMYPDARDATDLQIVHRMAELVGVTPEEAASHLGYTPENIGLGKRAALRVGQAGLQAGAGLGLALGMNAARGVDALRGGTAAQDVVGKGLDYTLGKSQEIEDRIAASQGGKPATLAQQVVDVGAGLAPAMIPGGAGLKIAQGAYIGALGAGQGGETMKSAQDQGVDEDTARHLGYAQIGKTAVGSAIPIALPGRLVTRALSGAAIGAGTDIASNALDNSITGDQYPNMHRDLLEGAAAQGIVGAVLGGVHGPRSMIAGANERPPSANVNKDPIADAINVTDRQYTQAEIDQEFQQRQSALDLGVHAMPPAPNGQRDLFGNTRPPEPPPPPGGGGLVTPPRNPVDTGRAPLPIPQEPGKVEPAPITEPERDAVIDKFGAPQKFKVGTAGIGFEWQGKQYFHEKALEIAIDKYAEAEREKTPFQRTVELALADAHSDQNPVTPGILKTMMKEYFPDAHTVKDVADRIDVAIKKLDAKGSKTDQAKLGVLEGWRDNLLGEKNGRQANAGPESTNAGAGENAKPAEVAQPAQGQAVGAVEQAAKPAENVGASQAAQSPASQGREQVHVPVVPETKAGGQGGRGVTERVVQRKKTVIPTKKGEAYVEEVRGPGEVAGKSDGSAGVQSGQQPESVRVQHAGAAGEPEGSKQDNGGRESGGRAGGQGNERDRNESGDGRRGVRGSVSDLLPADRQALREKLLKQALGEKDYAIYLAHAEGKGLAEIAKEHGITAQRVSQIVGEKNMAKVREKVLEVAKQRHKLNEEQLHELLAEKRVVEEHDQEKLGESPAEQQNKKLAAEDVEEEGKRKLSVVESAGGGEGNVMDSESLTQKWLEATEKGDTKKAAAIEKQIREAEAKRQKPAKKATKPVEKKDSGAPKDEGRAKTAKDLWDDTKIEGKPEFDELPVELQNKWKDNVYSGHNKLADMSRIYDEYVAGAQEGKWHSTGGGTHAGETHISLADLIKHEHVQTAFRNYAKAGLGHVVDRVDHWHLNEGTAGSYWVDTDGQTHVSLPRKHVESGSERSIYVVQHELAHVLDRAAGGGVYSIQPEMQLVLSAHGLVNGVGKVVRELVALHGKSLAGKADPIWHELLDYPLNPENPALRPFRNEPPNIHALRVRAELFAQVLGEYHGENRAKLERDAPETAKFLEEVTQHARTQTEVRQTTHAGTIAEAKSFGISRTPRVGTGRVDENEGNAERSGVSKEVGGKPEGPDRFDLDFTKPGRLNSGEHVYEPQSREDVNRAAEDILSRMPPAARGPVRKVFDTIHNLTKKGVYSVSFGPDLADWAVKKGIPAAKGYMDTILTKGAYLNDRNRRLGEIGRGYYELKRPEQRTVNEYLYDSTNNQKWGYKPAWDKDAKIDRQYEARFRALSPEARQVIKDVNEHGHKTLMDKAAVLEQMKKALGEDAVQKFKSFLPENTGPYAPLRRFGDYVVAAKSHSFIAAEKAGDKGARAEMRSNPDHYYVHHVESIGEGKDIAQRLRSHYAYVSDPVEKEPYYHSQHGASWEVLEKLKQAMATHFSQVYPEGEAEKMSGAFNKTITEMYIQSLGEHNARVGELKRKNVPGIVKQEMMRAFLTQGHADNHFIASMMHNNAIEEQMGLMREQARDPDQTPESRSARQELVNEFQKRQIKLMESGSTPEFVSAVLKTTGIWRLLTSPGYYMQYISQPHTMATPILAGRYGYFKAHREMLRGMQDAAAMAKSEKGTIVPNIDTHKNAEEAKMLKALHDRGILGHGHEQDFAQEEMISNNAAQRMWQDVTNKLARIPRGIEAFNRTATALAAYRLSMRDAAELKMAPDQAHARAVERAADTIQNAYGNYSQYAAPRAMMGPVAKVITQFRKFQVIHMSLVARQLHNAFNGATPTERKIAKLQFAYMMGHYSLWAGAVGMPMAGGFAWLAQKMFGAEGEPEDAELFLRRHLPDGVDPDLILKGIPAYLGADLSYRAGAGDILSPFKNLGDSPLESRDHMNSAIVAMLGPAVGTAVNVADGLTQMAKGDYYKGLETALPTGIRDGLRAMRYANEGMSTRKGDVVMRPEDINSLDVALQAVGLNPTNLADRQFRQHMVSTYDHHFKVEADEMKQAYAKAYRENDNEAIASIRDDWQKMNDVMVKNGFKRYPLQDLLRAPSAEGRRERGVLGGVTTSKRDKGFAEQLMEAR